MKAHQELKQELKHELSRRELLRGALAAGLTIVGVAGCTEAGTGEATPASTGPVTATDNGDGTALVAGGAKLAQGTALPIQLPSGQPALLLKAKDGQLTAMSALCTHSGCKVNWQADEQKLLCPCHGSIFDTSGKALSGPAKAPLPKIAVQIKGDDAVLQLKSA